MRIGIDCRQIEKAGSMLAGVEYYTLNLVQNLLKRYPQDEFVLFFEKNNANFLQANAKGACFPFFKAKRFLPLVYSHYLTARFIKKQKLDVFHAPANIIPLGYQGKSVVTIHDLAIYNHPEWFPKQSKFSQNVSVPRSLRKARKIISVSTATKNQIIERFHIDPQKIKVVYEAGNTFLAHLKCNERMPKPFFVRAQLRDQGLGADKRARAKNDEGFKRVINEFILFIGTLEPRKNLVRLIQAFDECLQKLSPEQQNLQLVLAGKRGWKCEQIDRAIESAKYKNNIQVLGYITEEKKQKLLKNCSAFVFPSLWEGFGLPILEAMAAGVPVLTSRVSALPEVGGEGVWYIENPEDTTELAKSLSKLITATPAALQELGNKGLVQAQKFTWQKTAHETYNIYKEVIKNRER